MAAAAAATPAAAACAAAAAAGCFFDLACCVWACFVLVFELWRVFDIGPKIQTKQCALQGQGHCQLHLRLMHLDFHRDGDGDGDDERLSKRGTSVIGHFH